MFTPPRLAALLLCLTLASSAAAQDALRPEDSARLTGYSATLGDALMQALSGGDPADVAQLTKALSGTPDIAFDETLAGNWKCRTIKLGGISPLLVYTPFDCRFTLSNTGFSFEKLSGSQRTKGNIQLRDGRAIYLGVGFLAGENPPAYADLPPDFTSNGTIQTQIAVFERINQTRARLLFPSPAIESDFDILELTR